MIARHILFCLEQSYGHIVPTIGMALEIMRRGHRVTYTTTPEFASAIVRCGANACVYRPLETRQRFLSPYIQRDGGYSFNVHDTKFISHAMKLRKERTAHSLVQLESLLRDDKPAVIIHDNTLDAVGSALARRLSIASIRHVPHVLRADDIPKFSGERLILVGVPKFFVTASERFDERFEFIGFIPEGRARFFESRGALDTVNDRILACPTTGLLPQIEFCKLVIDAFADQAWELVLSLSTQLDPASWIDKRTIPRLPGNFKLNSGFSNLDILECCRLLVGQGGSGSTLEALYCGVPVVLIPASPFHEAIASRTVELGAGRSLAPSEISPEALRQAAADLLADTKCLDRVKEIQKHLRANQGAERATDLIESFMSARC